jgi:hypothetical protein
MQDATEFGESWRFSISGKKVSVVGIDWSAGLNTPDNLPDYNTRNRSISGFILERLTGIAFPSTISALSSIRVMLSRRTRKEL